MPTHEEIQQLAFDLWQLVFNRPVAPYTTGEIYSYCAEFILKNPAAPANFSPQNYETNGYLMEAMRSFPPTEEEIRPIAYQVWKNATYLSSDSCWSEATFIIWRGRGE